MVISLVPTAPCPAWRICASPRGHTALGWGSTRHPLPHPQHWWSQGPGCVRAGTAASPRRGCGDAG